MRTTLELDEQVLAAARALAQDEGISLGSAVSELARRGLRGGRHGGVGDHGLPVFVVPPEAPPITLELVNAHRDDV